MPDRHARGAESFTWDGNKTRKLSPTAIAGSRVDYPKPATIGPDRLANARAGLEHFGAPVVIVDFGTAVTFDIVDA